VCRDAIALVRRIAAPSSEIIVLDMHDPGVARRANELGVSSVPAVAIDGALASCCEVRGLDEATLRAAGIGA
jgi:hypothetical protein